jgi:HK97 gp10 family phage protein
MAGKNEFVLKSFVKEINKEIDKNARQNVYEACKYARKEVQSVLNKRHKSSPGSPPGKLSGALRKSIRYKVTKEVNEYQGIVGSTDFKANWMEFGTSKMQARPYLLTTLQEKQNEIRRILSGKLVD